MNTDFIKELAKELATKLNSMLNIPIVSEEDEQAVFELVTTIILELVFSKLKGAMKNEK